MMGSGSKSQVQVPKMFGFHWAFRGFGNLNYFSLLGFESGFPPWVFGFSGTSTHHYLGALFVLFFPWKIIGNQ